MIKEEYVSFEVARFLKDKGFDQNCATYYLDGQVWRHYHGEIIPKGKQIYAAPTQAIAMKWLREVHNLFIEINLNVEHSNYYSCIYKTVKNGFAYMYDMYKVEVIYYITYEQACEAAIKYCLENLL